MRAHLEQILSSSASSIFALRKLRSHSLQVSQLHLVARSTTVASLLYASPAWWGFTSAEERARMERLIARLVRGGYLPQDFPTFEELAGYLGPAAPSSAFGYPSCEGGWWGGGGGCPSFIPYCLHALCRPTVVLAAYTPARSRTCGRRRLGAGVWAPAFGRPAVWAPDVWAPALMREEIGFYRHYHYFINPV